MYTPRYIPRYIPQRARSNIDSQHAMVNLIPLLSTTALLLAITSSASTTLHSSIRHAGKLYFGTTADHDTLKNPNIAKTIQQEFGALTPEYSMKWSRVQPHEGNFTLTNSDWVVGWAVKNRKRVRGHTLVWHDSLPYVCRGLVKRSGC